MTFESVGIDAKEKVKMNIIKNSIVRALWALIKNGYLKEEGWFRSFCSQSAVNASGEPIPWINYSMLHFLTSRLPENISILEYGSGNSTLYWAQLCKQIVSVEHDALWINYIRNKFSDIPNIQLLTASPDEGYETAPAALDKKFELIIIDGIRRIECANCAIKLLSEDGCILFDDTLFSDHIEVFEIMKKYGFKALRISGAKPIQNDRSEATIFYRSNNILGI